MPMRALTRPFNAALFAVAASLALLSPSADAAEKLRVGKAVPEAFSFVPLDIGMRKGFFAKNGLDIESIAFAGDARMQQAMASDSLDIALGSGPAMAFIVKGSPIKGVAAMAGPPLLLAIVVRPDGPKTVTDLKGKKISVSTAGSLTYGLGGAGSLWGGPPPPRGGKAGAPRASRSRRWGRCPGRSPRSSAATSTAPSWISATPSRWRSAARAASWCASPISRTSTST
jgi:hypothetical protein